MSIISCYRCRCMLYSKVLHSPWICTPCSLQTKMDNRFCIACSLSEGILISTPCGDMLHFLCACILNNSQTELVEDMLQKECIVDIKVPHELYKRPCSLCGTKKCSVAVECSTCNKSVHLSCATNKVWKIKEKVFECGCLYKNESSVERNI